MDGLCDYAVTTELISKRGNKHACLIRITGSIGDKNGIPFGKRDCPDDRTVTLAYALQVFDKNTNIIRITGGSICKSSIRITGGYVFNDQTVATR